MTLTHAQRTGSHLMATAAQPRTGPYPSVVDTTGAAEYLGLHPRTLDNWRSQDRGPRYGRIGRRIIYRVADLEEFLESRIVEPGR